MFMEYVGVRGFWGASIIWEKHLWLDEYVKTYLPSDENGEIPDGNIKC